MKLGVAIRNTEENRVQLSCICKLHKQPLDIYKKAVYTSQNITVYKNVVEPIN